MLQQPTDWAWPALIQSLQHDIVRLHETVETLRRDTSAARDRHRDELDELIAQLRAVRSELDPIIEERKETQKAKREMFWDWVGRGGWVLIAGLAAAAWHYLNEHIRP